ncbi:MAG: type II toxin-antitoxin system HicB family antitoxin [Snowella sp.]|nr:type II toxin-antitoxin system HicB family antitoxin [Snowella sp.]
MVKYTIVIQWSEEDNCFVVFLPEFETVMQPVTHGQTYEAAFQNAQEVLALLTESDDEPLPNPKPLLSVA